MYTAPYASCTTVIELNIPKDVLLRPLTAYTLPVRLSDTISAKLSFGCSPHREEQLAQDRHQHEIRVLGERGHRTTAELVEYPVFRRNISFL